MNELLFLAHILLVISLILVALRLGKEALIALFALQIVTANLFVVKQIQLFGFTLTCTDVFTVGSMLTVGLLQEYFGRDIAKKAIWIGLFSMIFFVLMALIHNTYFPSPHDWAHDSYNAILATTPRLFLASIIAAFSSQFLDIKLLQALRHRLPTFALRLGVSVLLTQFVDTLLFSYLGLYGLVNSVWSIILASYAIKVIMIVAMTPFTTLAKKLTPHAV